MNIKPVFHPWEGAQILERDLPPGVRYRYTKGHAEYIAAEGGRVVTVRDRDGNPCYCVPYERRGVHPVTIVNWPDWCGPRPDAQPTRNQIRTLAPHPDALTVWKEGGRVECGGIAGFYGGVGRCDYDKPCNHFLGWLTLEDER